MMKGSLRLRAAQVAIGIVCTLLLIVAALGVLYWLFVREVSLLTLIERIWPYLPVRYESATSEAGVL